MLKQFQLIKKDEKGFFLPFVLVVSLIIIVLITTFVKLYESELIITKNLTNQLEIDTIVQMSVEQLKNDLSGIDRTKGEFHYTFPNKSDVKVKYTFLDDERINLNYIIKLPNDEMYDIIQLYTLKSNAPIDE